MKDSNIVIGFIGKAQAGKDTCSSMAQKFLSENDIELTHFAFADLLKKQCKDIAYWDGEKDDEGRILLQTFSAPIKRYANYLSEKYPDNEFYQDMKNGAYYAANTLRDIRNHPNMLFSITDMRFMDEITLFNSKPDIDLVTIRVKRFNPDGTVFTGGLSPEALADRSENELNDYQEDYTIINDGTLDDLDAKVRKVIYDIFLDRKIIF